MRYTNLRFIIIIIIIIICPRYFLFLAIPLETNYLIMYWADFQGRDTYGCK